MADLDLEGFWKEALVQLRTDLGEEAFGGWFSDLKYIRAVFDEATGKGSIVIGAPSTFIRDKLKTRYQKEINSRIKEKTGKDITVEYEITGKTAKKEAVQPQSPSKNEEHAVAEPAETHKTKKKRDKHSQMRDDFVFDRFVIGENNSFAANAAIAISKNPGKAYNPFLIFGGVGLGKTHLMQAIGNYIYDNSENEIIYTTSENFLNEYVQAIQDGKMNLFKNKFRNTNVLLIDDIQFFQNRDRVQEELFHTFNALLDAKKQLVFTCDRPPSELKKLDERLRSRFDQCLKVDLQPPRYEERCAILRATAESRNAQIPNEVIDLVSKNISSNVRDLISALNTLIAYTELMGKPITQEIAQQRLKSIFYAPRQENLSMDKITRVVADYFSLTPNDLKGKKKTQNIVFPRQLAMYIGREMTDYSTTELGQEFGGRDHTTVIHSIEKIKEKMLTDPTLESTIDIIRQNIKEFSAKY
ncbi:MAG: chromosomal replication initiator protein DnaA [Treponema sp.]|jgi:chromosomal replication initiator protein|nr:chromosomal replication initiator protein DnaA [Treponema sp.]